MGTEECGGWWLVAGRPLGSSKPPRERREEMDEVGARLFLLEALRATGLMYYYN